jgi:hypothetical protein
MEKAYSFKELGKMLASKGLPALEANSEIVCEVMFEWLEASAKVSATPIDDMAVPFYPMIKSVIAKQLDKIDGKIEG